MYYKKGIINRSGKSVIKNKDSIHNENVTGIYKREFKLLEHVKFNQDSVDLDIKKIKEHYNILGLEYEKLLRQVIKITRIGDSNQKKLLLAYEQIENQKEQLSLAYKKLETIARTDPLTRLSNRRDFLEKFQDEINRFERHKNPFSIVMADIDDFKQINDTYGHDCGDSILVAAAHIISTSVRKQDLVSRWGGEEFILLLPGSDGTGGKKVAEEIRNRIETQIFSHNDLKLSVTMTFGVSQFDGSCGIDHTIKQADLALYSGKRNGKNRVFTSKNIQETETNLKK